MSNRRAEFGLIGTRFEAFSCDPVTLARRLLGQRLVRIVRGRRVAGIIVETEAYLGAPDRAAHTFNGRRTARNESMYLGGGHAYVYFTYGLHYCFNVVCGEVGDGTAVLIRALHPTEGLSAMFTNRPAARHERLLCAGPARVTQALSIDRTLDGVDLRTSASMAIELTRRRCLPSRHITRSARVGVEYAGAWARRPLRFFVAASNYVSK